MFRLVDWETAKRQPSYRTPSRGRLALGTRHPPPPFSTSIDSKAFSISCKLIRINTCGQFPEVLILKDLRRDKTRQNTVKRGVMAADENKGVAKFELVENKKRQLKAGGTKYKAKCYLESSISQCHFLSRKKFQGHEARDSDEKSRTGQVPRSPARQSRTSRFRTSDANPIAGNAGCQWCAESGRGCPRGESKEDLRNSGRNSRRCLARRNQGG